MRDIEKNDVDITQLFKWKKKITLADGITDTSINLWLRIVGDADLNRAKTYGYRQAGLLRRSLKDPNSDERIAYLNEMGDYTDKETLVASLIILELPEAYQRILADIDIPEPKEPKSDSPQEMWEIYQSEVDSYSVRFSKEVDKELEKYRKTREKELQKVDEKEIYKLYENLIISRLCEAEMRDAYYDMCIFLGTYRDEQMKKRAFPTFDDYDNAHPHVKEELKKAYLDLEIGTDVLKKSPGATE